jgi:hypothetical protein
MHEKPVAELAGIEGIHDRSPAKSHGGGGSKENFRGVKNVHEILEQICDNLEGWPKNYFKMPFFAKFSFFWQKKFFRWGSNLRIFFRWGDQG